MTPPPTTTSFFGIEGRAMAWSLETTVLPSNLRNGSSTGAEPVAMTMFFAVSRATVSDVAPRGGAATPLKGGGKKEGGGPPRDRDLGGGDEGGGAGDDGDLAGLGELGDAAGELGDDVVLLLQHGREVDLDAGELDAVGGGVVFGEDELLGGVEQGLAGNAADVEAGAAEGGAFLDEGDLEAELGGAEGADVAAGAGADDDEVEGIHGGAES
jgi:hypothetical protein